jgi:hypothetical protein
MAITRSNPTPRIVEGESGLDRTKGFVSIQTAGARDLATRLLQVAGAFGDKALQDAVKAASKPIAEEYRQRVKRPLVSASSGGTGNLAKSVRTKTKGYENGSVAVAITGPQSTGNSAADDTTGSGNHSWLVEFGSGARRPGTQNRRTYINTHQLINKRFTRSGTMNDAEFEARRGRGYYFLMGSINERTRQAKAGKGYSHDFMPDGRGGTRPFTIGPGETYGAMPAFHVMEETINATYRDVQTGLFIAIQREINKFI